MLIDQGVNVNGTNGDGNTPLIVAAFMCHSEVVHYLLQNGASLTHKNTRGDTAIDVVSGAWNEGLAALYKGISEATGLKVDHDRLKQARPVIAKLLREKGSKTETP